MLEHVKIERLPSLHDVGQTLRQVSVCWCGGEECLLVAYIKGYDFVLPITLRCFCILSHLKTILFLRIYSYLILINVLHSVPVGIRLVPLFFKRLNNLDLNTDVWFFILNTVITNIRLHFYYFFSTLPHIKDWLSTKFTLSGKRFNRQSLLSRQL